MRIHRAPRLTFLFVYLLTAFSASAQDSLDAPPGAAKDRAVRKLSSVELERLSGPIALYPDVLIEQILPASTFPDQVVDAALLIKTKEDAKLIPEQAWDKSVQAIAYYPGVLKMMHEKISWTRSLGNAFLNQHRDLLDAIQRLRAKAQHHGNLESNEQQKVSEEKTAQGTTIIRVEPADPQVIYVPETTSSTYIESTPSSTQTLAPLVTFGLGMALGAAVSDDDDDDDAGAYWGPSGIWVSDDAYDDWYDHRRDTVEHMENQAKNRQDFREDHRSERQDFRQDTIKENPEQARQYYDQRKQQAQERRTASNDAASQRRAEAKSAYENRGQQYAGSRQQQLDAGRSDLQGRQWQSGSARDYGASRGYSDVAAKSSQRGAFDGMNSGSRASAYGARGAASRSTAQYRGGGGGRTSARGGAGRGGGGGGGRRR